MIQQNFDKKLFNIWAHGCRNIHLHAYLGRGQSVAELLPLGSYVPMANRRQVNSRVLSGTSHRRRGTTHLNCELYIAFQWNQYPPGIVVMWCTNYHSPTRHPRFHDLIPPKWMHHQPLLLSWLGLASKYREDEQFERPGECVTLKFDGTPSERGRNESKSKSKSPQWKSCWYEWS